MAPAEADREAIDILNGFVTYLEETHPRPEDNDDHWADIQKAKAWLADQEAAL